MPTHRAAMLSLALAGGLFGQPAVIFDPIITPLTRSANIPPLGVGSTETLQITLLNNGVSLPPGVVATPFLVSGACAGSVSLFDDSGKQIGSAAAFSVGPGEMQSLKFAFGQLASSGSRVEVRGTINNTPQSQTFCPLTYAVETFDTSSGSTHLYFTGSVSGFALPRSAGLGTRP